MIYIEACIEDEDVLKFILEKQPELKTLLRSNDFDLRDVELGIREDNDYVVFQLVLMSKHR